VTFPAAVVCAVVIGVGLLAQEPQPVLSLDPRPEQPSSPAGLLAPGLDVAKPGADTGTVEVPGLGHVLDLLSERSVLRLATAGSADLTGALTVEACVYWSVPPKEYGAFVVRKSDSGAKDGYCLQIAKDGNLRLQVNWDQGLSSQAQVPLRQWTYVAGAFDPVTKRAWVAVNDHVTEGPLAVDAIKPSQWTLHIGGTGHPGLSLQGFIAHLAIHDRALPAEALQAHAREWLARTQGVEPPERPVLRFIHIADTHITDESSVYLLEQAVDQINAMNPRPDFVVFGGDLSNASSRQELALFRSCVARLRVPWYAVVGNHDMGEEKRTFEEVLGPRNTTFDAGPVTCIVLDSTKATEVTFGGGFTDDTLAWLEGTLADLPPERPLLVFCHHCFYSDQPYAPRQNLLCDVENPQAALDLLEGRTVLGVFAGHAHMNAQTMRGETAFVVTAALSLTRANGDQANAGFREVTVYPTRIESRYRAVGEKVRTGRAVAAVVTQAPGEEFSGTTHEVIQAALDRVAQHGGGLVFVTEGTYEIRRPLIVPEGVALVGRGATLALPPLPSTRTSEAAQKGATRLPVESTAGFQTGMAIEVQAEANKLPYFARGLQAAGDGVLELSGELPADVPAGTQVVQAWNLLAPESHTQIVGLRLIGNREQSVRPLNHVTHCGIYASGPYPYDNRGPARPREHLRVTDCEISGFHHRGIALYNVAYALVSGCRVVGNGAEAVDFDHYCHDCVAVGNHLEDCPVGVECNDVRSCTVTGNRIVRCAHGVNIWEWFPSPVVNSDNLVAGNEFEGCETAVHCGEGAEYNHVAGNRFTGSTRRDLGVSGKANAFVGNSLSTDLDAGALPEGSLAAQNQEPR